MKLRKYQLATERVLIFLRSQDFHDTGLEMDLSGPTSFPNDILRVTSPAFDDRLPRYIGEISYARSISPL